MLFSPLKHYLGWKKIHRRLLPPKKLVHVVAMIIFMLNVKFGIPLLITLGVMSDGKKLQCRRTFCWWITLVDFIDKRPVISEPDHREREEIEGKR